MSSPSRSILIRDPGSTVLTIIIVGLLFRFLLSATVGLGVDESYAVAVARQFSLSYFDHPPLHFWIVGEIARLAQSERVAVLRLPFALCFAGTTWLTYRLTARLFGEAAGAIAALLLNVSAVFSLSTGSWVLPDGPLMLFTMSAASVLVSVLFPETSNGRWHPVLLWLAAGLFAGLAMLTKYHGVFVLAGTFLFLLTSP
ncbi:MAG: glycosyltransferase family 39 protein, partial [Gemmatimonadetes bacterium]|nr:glycosyltransferase family 39 protein [Gemmatimonadota bacterium]